MAAAQKDEEPSEDLTVRGVLREYATADPRTLGLFRIVFGVFLLVDLYRRLPDVTLFYTNDGMLPNHGAIFRPMSANLFSLYHAFSTRGEVLAAFGLTAIVYVLYAVGWKTKLFQILVAILVPSLHSRNIMLENGGDVVANILTLWTCFLPLGRRFSIDALLSSMRERREHDAAELNDRSSPVPPRAPIVSLAYAAAIVNLVVIYYFNVVHKDGLAWKQGIAVHYVFWADRLVQPSGVWLRQWVPTWSYAGLTMGTIVIESSIVVLLLSPIWIRSCRRVAALLVIALHCGFQTVGHFGLFSFVMMMHSILLLGPEDWDALAARMRKRLPSRVVFYDASCGVCLQVSRILKRLDHLGKLRFVGNDEIERLPAGVTEETAQQTVIATDASGKRVFLRNDAVAAIFRALPYGVVVAKLMELPGISGLARSAYDAIASRRQDISVALGYAACGLPPRPGHEEPRWIPPHERPPLFGPLVPRLVTLVTGVFILALGSQVLAENRKVPQRPCLPFTSNKVCLPIAWKQQPAILAAIAQYPRYFQGWSMFAPVPPNDDGNVVIDAITADGRHIDPLAGGLPVTFELPPADRGNLMTQFWYELHDRIRRDANTRYREHLRDYIANWQVLEQRPANDRIVSFEAWWVSRPTQPPGSRKRLDTKRVRFLDWTSAPPAPAPSAADAPPATSAHPPVMLPTVFPPRGPASAAPP